MPKGGGFQKNDVVMSSLDPMRAMAFVDVVRAQSRALTHEREFEINLGLEHLTPAAQEVKAKRERMERGLKDGG